MSVIEFNQQRRFSYADGAEFGAVGSYEQIDGELLFAVDPASPANAMIADLGLAPRDENGLVRFRADFSIVRPVDPNKGSKTVLVELPNRGRRRIIDTFNLTNAAESASPGPGDGFLFHRGFSIASIGWQWDVYRDDILMGLQAPMADISGGPDPGQTVVEIRPNERKSTWLLADRIHVPLRVADLEDSRATLYVRDYEDGETTEVARNLWSFAREISHGIEPSDEHIYLEGGFEPGKYYQIVYTTRDAPVAGAGLLAFRDVATFLRHDSEQLLPGMGEVKHVIGYGTSQTGRMIRHFLHLGLNVDEQGRMAFDGLLPHVAGARMGSFNNRYGQPSNQSYPNWGHMFPFADQEIEDPLTGRRDGLLSRLRNLDSVPKVFYTNSSAEYWRGDCSLLATDPVGKTDLVPDESSRIYHFAGTHHGAGTLPQSTTGAPEGAKGAQAFNVVDYTPLLRAALVNLVDWVVSDVAPPSNAHPRISDGTAVDRSEVLTTFDGFPNQVTPDRSKLWVIRTINLGPRADSYIGTYPPEEGAAYACKVSAVDGDGNELAGVRLPDVVHPVATHTGWNTRSPETGSPDQQIPMEGFSRWFPLTEIQRESSGDPRRSISERYSDRDEYERLVREVVQDLVESRYVLAEDNELVVENTMARYDYALAAVSGELATGRL